MKRKAFEKACLVFLRDSHPDEITASIFLLAILLGGILGTVITKNLLLGFFLAGVFVMIFFLLMSSIKGISQLWTTLKGYYKHELEKLENQKME